MTGLSDLTLLRPLWLLALPALAIIVYLLRRESGWLQGWENAVQPNLLAALRSLGRIVPGSGRRSWVEALTASLLVLALAGPAVRSDQSLVYRNLDGLVLVMDLSASVTLNKHFDTALVAARSVVDNARSRPTALIVYAGDAYVASAFTTDTPALGTTIAVLDRETVPDAGSRPATGLALARQMLSEASVVSGDVVLISDGGAVDETTVDEANRIRSAGSFLSTLSVPGTEPDAGVLEDLASKGGGATASVISPGDVVQTASQRAASRLESAGMSGLFWNDLGRYVLILALLPALALFRQRA